MALQGNLEPRWILSSLLIIAMCVGFAAANTNETRFSCVGERSTNIDREYCEALYPDTPCNSWEDCHTTSCSSCSISAGCECHFVPGNYTAGSEGSYGVSTCLPPEESNFVGSCGVFKTEDACESVTGCSWEPWYTSSESVTATTSSKESATNWLAVLVTVLVAVAFLVLVAAIVYVCRQKRTSAAVSNPKPGGIPIASAVVVVGSEDPKAGQVHSEP